MPENKIERKEEYIQDELPGFGSNWREVKASDQAIVNEGAVDKADIPPADNTTRIIRPPWEDRSDDKPVGFHNGQLVYPGEKPDYCNYPRQRRGFRRR